MSRELNRRGFAGAAMTLLALSLTLPAEAGTVADRQRSTVRASFTAGDLAAARPEGLPASVRLPGDDPAAFRAFLDGAPMASRAPWLALSGGGENGAFAAGLLKGWTRAGNRPDFGVVTGVSTGALIAPFAFVGASQDAALEKAYTETSAADVFEFGGGQESLTDTWPLKRGIERSVTPALLAAVAAEHRKGRRLLVVTTELDSLRPTLWDMGAIAAAGGPAGLKLFREVMLASAAIPGIFPPVMIDSTGPGAKRFQEMHADGGATSPFFVAPGRALLDQVEGGAPAEDRVPAPAIYVVVNTSLAPDFQVAQRSMLSILGRSLSAMIKAQTAGAIAVTKAFAARTGTPIHIATIDQRFSQTSQAPFEQGYMRALFAHGERLGKTGTAFDWSPDTLTTSATGRSASNAP
ncbi:patatin-like phospholipase family protein [Methylobacterium sp. SyP6R]|uniref:patatin-like phospholipase family protein n=1 Tax=Methylobacterium sp. SyP6R TaxID=2718876 RepID=UPI001F016AD2|nr:patatin-like phospholipase family protein [Methylobacterium sp. SyP6R]MCF4124909.1 patatin-like phospholipase family protein [Methylobacterium sp. SyP6R]